MIQLDPAIHLEFERKLLKRALFWAITMHLAALSFLFLGKWIFIDKTELPPVMSVGLASASSLGGPGGKKTKAPVMRKNTAPPVKKVTQPKPEAVKKKTTPKKNEIGLNKEKEKKKVTSPPPEENPEAPAQANPGAKKIKGGTGGANETGISFEVGGVQEGTAVQDLPYLAYLQSVQSELAQRWARSGLSGGITTVTFRINRDGSIEDAKISESSGKNHLDGPALRAVLGARFPPLPQGCLDEYLILHYQFHYGDP